MNLALIPARAGSKRLPRKNMQLIGGRPLFQYTLEAVLKSRLFEEVIASSNDPNVLDLASEFEGVTTHKRPDQLATGSATTIDVLLYILREFGYTSGLCGLFLPTSPFREARHIQEAHYLLGPEVDSVISICAFEYPPQMAIAAHQEMHHLVLDISPTSSLAQGKTQTSNQEQMYKPNGAIYLSRIEKLLKNKSFFQGRVLGYHMDKISSIDIDYDHDLEFAKYIVSSKKYLSDRD